jgi:hypothetical protein
MKHPLFLSYYNETWIFVADFRTKAQISNFMKIRPVAAESFHVDGQTDMTKLVVACRHFTNAPKYRLFSDRQFMC